MLWERDDALLNELEINRTKWNDINKIAPIDMYKTDLQELKKKLKTSKS
jgi:hypothetical protein